jgi:hypothetical protein
MEIKKEIKFNCPNRLAWLITYNAGYKATVTLTYKDSTFPLFSYEFGNTIQRTPKVECGQEFHLENRELILTVTVGDVGYLDCITKKDFMTAGQSRKKVAERRLFMYEVSDNPDYRDYGGLSISFINFPMLL